MNELKTISDEELKQVIKEHKEYSKSYAQKGKKAVLINFDLSYRDFTEVNLENAVLVGSNLEGSIFRSARLNGINLRNTNLSHADFTKTDLSFANLKGSLSENIDLMNSNLRRADFSETNLTRADLRGADLTHTIFTDSNLMDAKFDNDKVKSLALGDNIPQLQEDLMDLKEQLVEIESSIEELNIQINNTTDERDKDALVKQKEIKVTEKIKLTTKIKGLDKTLKLSKSNLELQAQLEIEKQIQKQKLSDKITEVIGDRTDDAIEALQDSLKNTDARIETLTKSSNYFQKYGFASAISVIIFIGLLIISFSYMPELMVSSALMELFKQLGKFGFLLISFPIFMMFFMSSSLLKHSHKLSLELRHYTNMKHQIELYSGLLKAARYAAASIKDPEKAETYVEETFTKIRDKLLDSQTPESAAPAADKDEPVSIKDLAELIKSVKS